ncbi:MAG: NADH-quinone oxidoreductase subunit L [Candidatus Micrarchaeota archaeon]|nr:NADH-quinone oxidoreductase subunit L [Candidatus Micrarchaeota archaeon]
MSLPIPAAILPILPLLLAAAVAMLWRRSMKVGYFSFAMSLVSLALAAAIFTGPATQQSIGWFSIAGFTFQLGFYTLMLNKILLLLVSVVMPFVMLYSTGFIRTPSDQGRYYAEMCVFASSMMLFAVSGSFLTMFIAWEFLGLTSYLLIGFYTNKEAAALAARRSITIIFLGDIAMLAAIVLLFLQYGTLDFNAIMQAPGNAAVPLLLILFAAFTKSAQFPTNEWLPDAMEGPAPVSAFLHSSTMVKAGVFLVMVLMPMYVAAGLQNVILWIGIVTALLAVSNALVERHIKRILAYSTIEDLSLMLIAVGLGNLYAATLLFIVQAFYKAPLLLSSGSIMRMNDEQSDIFKIGNSPRNRTLFIAVLLASLSLASIFPFGSWIEKSLISSSATDAVVGSLLLLISFASSTYIFRWLFVPLSGSRKRAEQEYHALRKSMLVPAITMVLISLAISFYFIYNYLSTRGAGSIFYPGLEEGAVGLMGLAAAYLLFYRKHAVAVPSRAWLLYNRRAFDISYYSIARAFNVLASAADRFDYGLDRGINALGRALIAFERIPALLESGNPSVYMLLFAIGLAILVLAFGGSL